MSHDDENQLIAERREKLRALREAQKQGKGPAFPNDFKPSSQAAQLHADHGDKAAEALEQAGDWIQRHQAFWDGAGQLVALGDGFFVAVTLPPGDEAAQIEQGTQILGVMLENL